MSITASNYTCHEDAEMENEQGWALVEALTYDGDMADVILETEGGTRFHGHTLDIAYGRFCETQGDTRELTGLTLYRFDVDCNEYVKVCDAQS